MAPPPEYDKEPKAPDKSATAVTSEEIKVHSLVNDLPTFSDHKPSNSASNNETENNKHVESLDDGQLRALLDEAIQYKCPKDREGKSSLFKELLEEVEHQDEVSEAASRGFIARGGPHANSLQDLMAALKVESASRPVRHQPPPHSQTSVSARAIHGGSLPSGVDTSFMLAEEPTRGGYLATVRCVNPPPLAERRVSASDANTTQEMELLNKSKPMFPMYTARASLEIGSGAVSSGRAVTTTTPSNQVRTPSPPRHTPYHKRFHHRTLTHHQVNLHWTTTRGPPERIFTRKSLYNPEKFCKQEMLLNALRPRTEDTNVKNINTGEVPHLLQEEDRVKTVPKCRDDKSGKVEGNTKPRGPDQTNSQGVPLLRHCEEIKNTAKQSEKFAHTVDNWYKNLNTNFADGSNKVIKTRDKTVMHKTTPGSDNNNTRKMRQICHSEQHIDPSAKLESIANTVDRSSKDLKSADARKENNKKSDKATRPSGADSKNIVNKNKDIKSRVFVKTNNTSSTNSCYKSFGPKCKKSVRKDGTVFENSDLTESCIRPVEVELGDTSTKNILSPFHVEKVVDIEKNSKLFDKTVDNSHKDLRPECTNRSNVKGSSDKRLRNDGTRSSDMVKSGMNFRQNHNEMDTKKNSEIFAYTIDNWYKGLTIYSNPLNVNKTDNGTFCQIETNNNNENQEMLDRNKIFSDINSNIEIDNIAKGNDVLDSFTPNIISHLNDDINISATTNNKSTIRADNSDIRNYRKKVGKIERATLSSINPRNVKSMTIGNPEQINLNPPINKTSNKSKKELNPSTVHKTEQLALSSYDPSNVKLNHDSKSSSSNNKESKKEFKQKCILNMSDKTKSFKTATEVNSKLQDKGLGSSEVKSEMKTNQTQDIYRNPEEKNRSEYDSEQNEHEIKNERNQDENLFEMKDMCKSENISTDDIEMKLFFNTPEVGRNVDSFSTFLANQNNLFRSLESVDSTSSEVVTTLSTVSHNDNTTEKAEEMKENVHNNVDDSTTKKLNSEEQVVNTESIMSNADPQPNVPECLERQNETNQTLIQISEIENQKPKEHYVLAELSNNAYIFLTFPQHPSTLKLKEIENTKSHIPGEKTLAKEKTDDNVAVGRSKGKKKEISRNSLRVLLLETLLKRDGVNRGLAGPASAAEEVDSTIPFSCITTPEVVASCNTTSSTTPAAVAVDTKPLQLGSSYRAVASLTGALPDPPAAPRSAREQPRSVISSTFNGLPLSRPNYGATASADEYKKSLDENGNAVQGIGSPVSGSSQHKKPRRKKSSKNETVIKSHQIDGYQGNKDLNEVLRFIESNADAGRGGKLRGKHKDDDDKGKKRSTERRKAQEKVKRASSLEELSRTKLEDLTDAPEPPPAKPERRSWGDDARDSFYFRAAEPDSAPDHDFQTVTKRRKPRRERAERDERADRDPRRPRAPEPRARRESAPPSDRSNDSNDDMDSVHSLPAPPRAPLAAPHASYADIARTRHNIPDLIESCNFYAEGEAGGDARRPEPAPQPADADGYPALEARAAGVRRGKQPPAGAARRERKERAAPAECPAPDVVADRRPPVILLDSAAQPRDMDGVTFGFDINEQLLGGGARRPRCDLVRDAPDAEPTGAAPAPAAVPVTAGCLALRYVPPDPPPDTHHLHQIIDYVGAAWEDVIRCGTGKVRYFSE